MLLTFWAPEGGAGARALFTHENRCSTAAAGGAFAVVDPEPGGRIGRVCGTAASGVGHDGVPCPVGDVGSEKAARSLDQALDLLRAQARNLTEGIYSAGKANLGFEDVPDAGHYPLVQQDIPYLFVAMLEQSRRSFISGKGADLADRVPARRLRQTAPECAPYKSGQPVHRKRLPANHPCPGLRACGCEHAATAPRTR